MIDREVPFETILNQFPTEGLTNKNLYKFKKHRNTIIESFEGNHRPGVKSLKRSQFELIDQKLTEFVVQKAAQGIPIDTNVLKEEAKRLAVVNNIDNFKASEGFITNFKARNNVMKNVINGEAGGVPDSLCENWVNTKLPELIKDYQPKDVFNGDEFGLFWGFRTEHF